MAREHGLSEAEDSMVETDTYGHSSVMKKQFGDIESQSISWGQARHCLRCHV